MVKESSVVILENCKFFDSKFTFYRYVLIGLCDQNSGSGNSNSGTTPRSTRWTIMKKRRRQRF